MADNKKSQPPLEALGLKRDWAYSKTIKLLDAVAVL